MLGVGVLRDIVKYGCGGSVHDGEVTADDSCFAEVTIGIRGGMIASFFVSGVFNNCCWNGAESGDILYICGW